MQQHNVPRSTIRRILAVVTGAPKVSAAAAAIIVIIAAVWIFNPEGASGEPILTVPTSRGPLVISVTESGTIQSRERVVIRSEVEGRSTILYVIPEGTHVQAGDLLVELDASNLIERKTSQEISVITAEASFIQAREDFEVTRSQGESDVSRAELDYRFAQLDLNKYLEGDYPRDLQRAMADIQLSTEEQQRATDKLEWSERLHAEGYITETELSADRLAKQRADLNLRQAELALRLLEEYTYPRQLEQLESNVEQTRMALERTRRRASANLVQAEANLKARESSYNQQKAQLERLVSQIEKSRIKAPVAGMVVYATTGRGGFRGSEEPLSEGLEVRERQELIHLPTTDSMMAEIKIQESMLRKVEVGQPVRVTVDALPGVTAFGRVARVALLPDAQSVWLNPDLKVYNTEVHLQSGIEGLRPGMSCRAEVVVQQLDDALYVPVQSVMRVDGNPTVFVKEGRDIHPRQIEVGYDNDRFIHVVAGLSQHEHVLLSPPLEAGSSVSEVDLLPEADVPALATAARGSSPADQASREAAETPQTQAFDPARLAEMSPEERRAAFEGLSQEQRQQVREQMGSGAGRTGGQARPEGPRGGGAADGMGSQGGTQ